MGEVDGGEKFEKKGVNQWRGEKVEAKKEGEGWIE